MSIVSENLITNLPASCVVGKGRAVLKIGAHLLRDVASSYAAMPPQAPTIVAGSSGTLEIAINQDSAARLLKLSVGYASGTQRGIGRQFTLVARMLSGARHGVRAILNRNGLPPAEDLQRHGETDDRPTAENRHLRSELGKIGSLQHIGA